MVTTTEPIYPSSLNPVIHLSSHFFKVVKTIVLSVYNETVPVRIEKLLLLHWSKAKTQCRDGYTAFGSVSPLTPLHPLLSFWGMETSFNELARVLIINLNVSVVLWRGEADCGEWLFGWNGSSLFLWHCTELTSPVCWNLSPVLDWPLWFGGELSHQDPVWGSGGGVPGHGGPSALCRPLVPADHQIPAAVLEHHSHQVRRAPELLPVPLSTAKQG